MDPRGSHTGELLVESRTCPLTQPRPGPLRQVFSTSLAPSLVLFRLIVAAVIEGSGASVNFLLFIQSGPVSWTTRGQWLRPGKVTEREGNRQGGHQTAVWPLPSQTPWPLCVQRWVPDGVSAVSLGEGGGFSSSLFICVGVQLLHNVVLISAVHK